MKHRVKCFLKGLKLLLKKDVLILLGDSGFIEAMYRVLLGRPSDPEGKENYLRAFERGDKTRIDIVQEIIESDEYRNNLTNKRIKYDYNLLLKDFVKLFDVKGVLPYTEDPPFDGPLLCGLADPRLWLDEEWFEILKSLKVIPEDLRMMHRKGYEWVHVCFALGKLGVINEGARCLGVGAGHEPVSYWLANRTGHVVAIDLYKDDSDWANHGGSEGDSSVINDPGKYAPFPYRKERLEFKRMDGRDLNFEDNSFDIVFTISSIEHFGGHSQSAKSMAEMGRVLKPGGVAAVVTELIINDKEHEEFFSLDQLIKYVIAPSGLKLVQTPVFEVPRYALEHPSVMPKESTLTPHFVLDINGVIYTSVCLMLRK